MPDDDAVVQLTNAIDSWFVLQQIFLIFFMQVMSRPDLALLVLHSEHTRPWCLPHHHRHPAPPQAGFGCLEAGMVQSKNTANIILKNFSDFALGFCGFVGIGQVSTYACHLFYTVNAHAHTRTHTHTTVHL